MISSVIPLEPEQLVAGRYRLLRPLGSGGSAYVWAALDESLGRHVALKALSGSSIQGGHERERLEREAQLLAALDHPRITTVFDFAENVEQDGTAHPFLVTELLDGENLSDRLKRGPLPPEEALTVCAQVADALATAHGSGVVHRDVKPGNVMLTPHGATLLDFGISRRQTDTDLTGAVLIGTPACMAPEQWRGETAQPASDVYALGCLLYTCLTGHAPYPDRELPALGLSHLLADPPELPLIGEHYAAADEVYQACMRKDPAERPSASEVAASLDVSAQPAVSITQTVTPERTRTGIRRWPQRRRFWVAAYVTSVSAVLAVSIALPLTRGNETPATNAPTSSGVSESPRTGTNAAATADAAHAGTAPAGSSGGEVAADTAQTPSAAKTHGSNGGHQPHRGKNNQ